VPEVADADGKDERKCNPDRAPNGRLFQADRASFAPEESQIQSEHQQNEDVKADEDPETERERNGRDSLVARMNGEWVSGE